MSSPIPGYGRSPHGPRGAHPLAPYFPVPGKRHGGLATASLVLGIVGMVFGLVPGFCWIIGWPCGVLAIIFGAIAWKGWAKAKAGLILGVLAIVAGTIWLAVFLNDVHTTLSKFNQCVHQASTQTQIDACRRYLH